MGPDCDSGIVWDPIVIVFVCVCVCERERERERERGLLISWAKAGKDSEGRSNKLREAKATTLRRVLLARSCAMGGGRRGGRG